jgi:ubiquinone/menaquinone biosynthesis C-methylase UbiE
MAVNVTWDYTDLAVHYDKRADYSPKAIDRLFLSTGIENGAAIADIGAGTGKLALPLARRGCCVSAVEPNSEMRKFGIMNTQEANVTWSEGQAEDTGLPTSAFRLVTFGSSFNVVDQAKSLAEVDRILKPYGWIACLWNHRDLHDPMQAEIESLIRHHIPQYQYGSRRQNPTPAITASGFFASVSTIEEYFTVDVSTTDYIEAWRSHATLRRQAGEGFHAIISKIESGVSEFTTLSIPYYTRMWYAQRVPTTIAAKSNEPGQQPDLKSGSVAWLR